MRLLADAIRSDVCFGSLALSEQPSSLEEAYDQQEQLEQALGFHCFGWKIANASPRGRRSSPAGKPTFGRLWAECRHENGGYLPLPRMGLVTIEVELAVRFARDASPSRERFDPSMIDGMFVAFELLRSRFLDRKPVGHHSQVADNAGFHAFVLGDQIAGSLDPAAAAGIAMLRRDGDFVSGAVQGDARINLVDSLCQFWSHATERQLHVPVGSLVTTGTQTVPVDTRNCGVYVGEIGSGTVRMILY